MNDFDERITVGPLEIRPTRYLVLVDGKTLPLSGRELTLLTVLARRRGEIVSRSELFQLAWGRQLSHTDRSVDVYVHKLRRKLETAVPEMRFIHTHHTVGYRLDPQPLPLKGPRGPRDGPAAAARFYEPVTPRTARPARAGQRARQLATDLTLASAWLRSDAETTNSPPGSAI